jgi:hypothetical protein
MLYLSKVKKIVNFERVVYSEAQQQSVSATAVRKRNSSPEAQQQFGSATAVRKRNSSPEAQQQSGSATAVRKRNSSPEAQQQQSGSATAVPELLLSKYLWPHKEVLS